MRPKDIPLILQQVTSIGKNVVFIGNPGIGKTVGVEDFARRLAEQNGIPFYEAEDVDDVRQFAEENCPGGNCVLYIYVNVNTALPVDLAGIPEKFRADGDVYVRWVPLNVWLACRHAKYCIIFIDEFNTTENPDMLAAIMRMLGECRAGNVHLGCGKKRNGFTVVVAAGNPPSVSGLAMEPPSPLLGGKVVKIDVEPPTIPEWITYMHDKYGDNWCPRVASFLAMNPHYFSHTPSEPRTLTPYPTPRGWDAVARLCGTECKCNKELVEGLVGPEAASALLANMEVSPTLEEVAAETDPFTKGLKLIAYMGVRYCGEAANIPEDRLEESIKNIEPEVVAAATYIAAPQCPQKMAKLYRVAERLGIADKILRERYRLSEVTETSPDTVIAELL